MGAISNGATESGDVRIPGGKKFYPVLEGLRGAAAILVLFRHIPTYGPPINFQMSYLAVDLFFVLSGFVIANSYEQKLTSERMSFKEFAVLRVIRIFPLYLIGSLIGLVALFLNGTVQNNILALSVILALVMLPLPVRGLPPYPLNNPSWSLFFEFFANFFYAKFVKILNNRTIIIITILSLLILIYGATTSPKAMDLGWGKKTFLFGFPRVLFSFLVGVLIYRLDLRNGNRRTYDSPLLAVAAICASIAIQVVAIDARFEAMYGLFAVAILFPLIVYFSVRISVKGKILGAMMLLGEISFPLYALHSPLYQISHVAFGAYLDPYAPYTGIAFAFVAIAIALMFHSWVDVPLRKHLRAAIMHRLPQPSPA